MIKMDCIVTMDKQGRIYLPKEMREKFDYKVLKGVVEGDKLILKPMNIARKSRGIFKVKRPIEDVDELAKKYSKQVIEDEIR
ncbi:MAG: hypothetical protein BME93_03655 [Methanosarcinales archaeon Met12]|nr:MAG: hypothetical protein BME93_03655 [Methanosarcinales archaeon Met12]